MSLAPVVSVIIPTKERESILFDTLARLAGALNGVVAEVIVINDSKTSNLVLLKDFDFAIVVDNPGQGVASARNFGASLAKSDLLWFIDDDMWIEKNLFNN